MLNKKSVIFLAGHKGLVGSAVFEYLKKLQYRNILTIDRSKIDLRDTNAVEKYFKNKKIDYMIMAAARAGGILANSNYQDEFLTDNTSIQNNLLLLAKKKKIKRTIFLGSSCIYPKNSKTPIKEESLLTGKLESTNQCYAIAKIAGIKLSEALYKKYNLDIVCLMPTNAYGYNDTFDEVNGHVIPAMIKKFLYAKKYNKNKVILYGSGKPLREFIFSEDLASAIIKILGVEKNKLKKIFKKELPILNVGSGKNISIKKLAQMINKITKYKGKIIFDKKFPDGTFKKNISSKKILNLGWQSKTDLHEGISLVVKRVKHKIV